MPRQRPAPEVPPDARDPEASRLREALLVERAARKRAEDALLLTRFAVDHAAEPVFTLSPAGRILDANETAARRYGYRRDVLIGLTIDTLESDGARGRFADVWSTLADGAVAVVESVHVDRDGALMPVDISFARFVLGGQAYCCASARDLTERQLAQQALRDSEQRLRALVDNLPAAMTLKDRAGHYTLANPEFERWFGLEHGAVLGLQCNDILDAEMARNYLAADARVLSGARSVEWEERLSGGVGRDVSVTKFPVADADGEVIAIGSIALDVTRTKRIEQALRESEERLDLAVRGSSDGLWDRPDLDSEALWWSPRVYELLGFEPNAFAPTTGRLRELTHPDDRPLVAAAQALHLERREPFDVEYRMRTQRAGYRWFRVRGQAIWNVAGRALRISGSMQDVTTIKEAEERRIAAVRAQRDALVREVHHRIKNHLQGIMGLLTQYAARDPEIADAVGRIRTQVNSIAVVHGLQGRSRDGTVWLAGVVDAILQAARGVYSHRFDAELDRGAMAGVVLAEREAVPLALILNELVTNAFKHGDLSSTEGRAVRVTPFNYDDRLGLRVFNAGASLPESFDFESGRGLGTGLGLVRALMPSEGVSLHFESTGGGVSAEVILTEPVVHRVASEATDVGDRDD